MAFIFRYLHDSQVLNTANSPVERAVLEGEACAIPLAAVRLMGEFDSLISKKQKKH